MDKRILVITSCTKKKRFAPKNQLTLEDFRNPVQRMNREKELSAYQTTAWKMYTGRQHLALQKGVTEYRQKGGQIDITIVSDGYGVLAETDIVVPYEVSMEEMGIKELRAWEKEIGISSKLRKWLLNYDLVFVLLGQSYLKVIDWPDLRDDQKLIFFSGYNQLRLLPKQPHIYLLCAGRKEASHLGSGLIQIKGHLFSQLLRYFATHSDASWNMIDQNPSRLREYILTASCQEPLDQSFLLFRNTL